MVCSMEACQSIACQSIFVKIPTTTRNQTYCPNSLMPDDRDRTIILTVKMFLCSLLVPKNSSSKISLEYFYQLDRSAQIFYIPSLAKVYYTVLLLLLLSPSLPLPFFASANASLEFETGPARLFAPFSWCLNFSRSTNVPFSGSLPHRVFSSTHQTTLIQSHVYHD